MLTYLEIIVIYYIILFFNINFPIILSFYAVEIQCPFFISSSSSFFLSQNYHDLLYNFNFNTHFPIILLFDALEMHLKTSIKLNTLVLLFIYHIFF